MGAVASTIEEEISASARTKGCYYATIEDVWDSRSVPFHQRHLDALRRTQQEVSQIPSYDAVIAAMSVDDDPALGSSRSASMDRTIPDITGEVNPMSQGAHLIPHNKTCAVAFGPVAELALGQNLQEDGDDDDNLEITRKRHRLVVGVMVQRGAKRRKLENTGLKHSDLNKLKIMGQKEHMDNRPCLLIVPILSLSETKAWKSGDPYVALFCAGGYEDANETSMNVTSSRVYKNTMIEFRPRCTKEELETATDLLSAFTRGLAQSLSNGECLVDWTTNEEERRKLETVRNNLNGQIRVPVFRGIGHPFRPVRVAKVRFDSTDGALPNPPDPFLLVLKATIIWSWRNNQKLLPGYFIPEQDEWSEGDEIMHEHEERLRQESIRPSNHVKIARGLGLTADETTVFKLD